MRALTPLQRHILTELARLPEIYGPPDSGEIAENIAPARGIRSWQRRPVTEHEQVAACLARMATKGWVERLGKSMSNSWCWAITDAGLAALNEGRTA